MRFPSMKSLLTERTTREQLVPNGLQPFPDEAFIVLFPTNAVPSWIPNTWDEVKGKEYTIVFNSEHWAESTGFGDFNDAEPEEREYYGTQTTLGGAPRPVKLSALSPEAKGIVRMIKSAERRHSLINSYWDFWHFHPMQKWAELILKPLLTGKGLEYTQLKRAPGLNPTGFGKRPLEAEGNTGGTNG